MTNRILNRTLLFVFFTTTFIALTLQISDDNVKTTNNNDGGAKISKSDTFKSLQLDQRFNRQPYRLKRATRRPGFFRTLFSVIYDQWNDTRHTVGRINNLVNDNFLPENASPVETTTSSDPNATTTQAPYKIKRSEFNRIVQRNLRGLARLYNIELRDALKQSDKNWPEYRKNASLEVSKFL